MKQIDTGSACGFAKVLYEFDCELHCEFFSDSFEFVVTHVTPMLRRTELARAQSIDELESDIRLSEIFESWYAEESESPE